MKGTWENAENGEIIGREKTKHTPGPWFAAKDGWSSGTVTHNLSTGHIGQICIVQCVGAKTQAEGNANACLIAAAPDLLEALKLAEATINRLHRHAPGSANGTLDVIKAAIQKAEGAS